MTDDTRLLVGSLSSDLLRVASLTQRGSTTAAQRFLFEAKRWALQLQSCEEAAYIKNIAADVRGDTEQETSLQTAEKYLMYSVLLQNYTVHHS
ncbi:MAG: hypothetical protein GW947_02120 [Candidatus Pacebacteria bacterium]|nr:hypothetical protein [Candidatus Paceibacterota bacterium]